jgi:hypothetical protein
VCFDKQLLFCVFLARPIHSFSDFLFRVLFCISHCISFFDFFVPHFFFVLFLFYPSLYACFVNHRYLTVRFPLPFDLVCLCSPLFLFIPLSIIALFYHPFVSLFTHCGVRRCLVLKYDIADMSRGIVVSAVMALIAVGACVNAISMSEFQSLVLNAETDAVALERGLV